MERARGPGEKRTGMPAAAHSSNLGLPAWLSLPARILGFLDVENRRSSSEMQLQLQGEPQLSGRCRKVAPRRAAHFLR